jgi:hypothetical protein
MLNAVKCELKTENNLSRIKDMKQKVLEQKKDRTRKITFGKVKEYSGTKIQESDVSFETKPKEMISGPIFEKFPSTGGKYGIAHIIGSDPKTWERRWMYGCFYDDLLIEAEVLNISMDDIKKDLKMIYNYFRQETPAILGYKSSWKLGYQYKTTVYNDSENKWEIKMLLYAPNLRLYLIKVVKDEDFSATIIQTVWRQHRDKKILKLLKGFKSIVKILSGKHCVTNY